MRRKRGPKSAAELEVARLAAPVATVQRPDAPYELTQEEADEWRQITEAMPADWFGRQHWPLLSQLCRNIVAARKLSIWVHKVEGGNGEWDPDLWLRLLKSQEAISKTIATLSSKMRLSHISTMRQDRIGKPGPESMGPWPWEFKG